MNLPSRIVVIGGSAGALEPLMAMLAELPPDLDMAYFVVIHFPANRTSILPSLLNRATRLKAGYAESGEEIMAGRVYVAPSDRHLVVDDGRVSVINGPKENASRPSIDVLFRSAAISAGPRVIGIVLSGSLDDGSAGLLSITKHGGRTIAQDPLDAMFGEMPQNAVISGKAQSVLPAAAIAGALCEIASERPPEHVTMSHDSNSQRDRNGMPQDEPFEKPSPFVCPECQGTLWQVRDDELERYRCRVGHAYSEQTLWEQKGESLEAALWAAQRALHEQADLSKRIAENARSRNNTKLAARYDDKRRAAEMAQKTVRDVLLHVRPTEDEDAGAADAPTAAGRASKVSRSPR